MDHRAFWAERLMMLQSPTIATLAAAISMQRLKLVGGPFAAVFASPVRTAGALLRTHGDKYGDTNAHDLLLNLQRRERRFGGRPLRRLTRQGTKWMLPNRENALWDEEAARAMKSADDSGASRQSTPLRGRSSSTRI